MIFLKAFFDVTFVTYLALNAFKDQKNLKHISAHFDVSNCVPFSFICEKKYVDLILSKRSEITYHFGYKSSSSSVS